MDEAEHGFTEVAMRASLTRAYYAMHHLGIALTQEANHGRVREALRQLSESLGEEYGYFLQLRQRADYDPDWVERQYGGLSEFRIAFRDDLVRARVMFQRLRKELHSDDGL